MSWSKFWPGKRLRETAGLMKWVSLVYVFFWGGRLSHFVVDVCVAGIFVVSAFVSICFIYRLVRLSYGVFL